MQIFMIKDMQCVWVMESFFDVDCVWNVGEETKWVCEAEFVQQLEYFFLLHFQVPSLCIWDKFCFTTVAMYSVSCKPPNQMDIKNPS